MIQLMRWAKRKHPTRSKKWIRNKYLLKDVSKEKSRLRFGYTRKRVRLLEYTLSQKLQSLDISKLVEVKVYMTTILFTGLSVAELWITELTVNRFFGY